VTRPVVLTGPANAAAFVEWLDPQDGRSALELPGLRGTSLTNLAKAFLAIGEHVELVTLAPELKGERVVLEGRRLRILIGPYRTRARNRCADVFREERRHVRELLASTSGAVINAHWTYEFALGATRLPSRVPVVTARDAPFTILRYSRTRAYRALCAAMAVAVRLRGPTMTAVSPYIVEAWRKQMLYRTEMSVVPNVVPLVAISRPSDATEHLAPTILEVADAGKLKNVAALIRAMPEILSAYSRTKLNLAGHGLTGDSTLANLARRLGVDHAVRFLGFLPPSELDAIYRQADLFVHASLEESFSMSIAESMSYGLPIVAGERSGAVPWLLDEGRAGLLVDVRRPAAIAKGVVRLLTDPGLRRELGAAGQARVRSHFSPDAVAARYLDVYARAAAA